MQASYYRLPLRLDQVIQSRKLPSCPLKHSIAQNLHLVISTYRGESAYSDDFGCSLWDEEFNIQLNPRWRENLCDSLKQAIAQFEKRLLLQEVKANMEEQNELLERQNLRVRRCLHIELKGIIKKTNESFTFRDSIYISPLAQK
ncbi:MAG: GPW/gp25 family protein [Bacteroidetes bacterium]|nr:GPW/gp25 family protein [Bacteroidota bacterium]MBS1974382.1 GPW/gp25 family protein [Bacteroidota bacterium]